jgi:hypothetical protein
MTEHGQRMIGAETISDDVRVGSSAVPSLPIGTSATVMRPDAYAANDMHQRPPHPLVPRETARAAVLPYTCPHRD